MPWFLWRCCCVAIPKGDGIFDGFWRNPCLADPVPETSHQFQNWLLNMMVPEYLSHVSLRCMSQIDMQFNDGTYGTFNLPSCFTFHRASPVMWSACTSTRTLAWPTARHQCCCAPCRAEEPKYIICTSLEGKREFWVTAPAPWRAF